MKDKLQFNDENPIVVSVENNAGDELTLDQDVRKRITTYVKNLSDNKSIIKIKGQLIQFIRRM